MRAIALALVALVTAPTAALAVSNSDLKNLGNGSPSEVHVTDSGAGQIGRVLIGLAIVVVVIVVLYAIVRRVHRGRMPGSSGSHTITVLDTVGIGAQRSLHLVRVGDRVVLIGATDHAITALQELTPEEAEDAGLTDRAATADEIALALAQPPAEAANRGLLDSIRDRTTR
jgi:flagellar biosynthetic protein FliO